ncbi:alpha/beta fold hydrolase [Nocardioides zeae]|uniref:Alpha/beta fold hydrolase n=1 Tax=Nocardioides imazamoxiresistens TaxID=3231893 RepID=A0ABU3PWN3_9ACTN|nr:prolyl oligopeptidase family serine peptidase [Nocardioides zeae]MDT9593614.1 alpha/beta fold hydrolase [Nocardioides zeae]
MTVRRGVAAAGLLLVTACTGTDEGAGPDASSGPSSSATSSAAASSGTPPSTATPTPEPTPPPAEGPADLSRWFDAAFTGGDLQLGEVREQTSAYTSYDASYRSEGLLITGVLNVPAGEGPFPAVVLAHGYIDPAAYEQGQGMTRERGVLATDGFVAFHVDYRGHAGSDDDPALVETQRFGYAVDVLNAATALRETDLVAVDDERVAAFGRSMGGGAVLEALEMAPGHLDAGVLYASVSSNAADNFVQFNDGGGFWEQLVDLAGTPEENPGYYAAASTRTYVDRVTEPVLVVHGSADDTCPLPWAEATHAALQGAGVDATLDVYDGEGHAFGPQFPASMEAISAFLGEKLG